MRIYICDCELTIDVMNASGNKSFAIEVVVVIDCSIASPFETNPNASTLLVTYETTINSRISLITQSNTTKYSFSIDLVLISY